MISILILTLNEASNIKACLDSVSWSDDVFVLDSGSADATAEISRSAGATVVTRPFDNWASHQNWAVANIPFRHKWVFYLDADERMTPELAAEIRQIAADSGETRKGFYCGRINYFMGRPITRCYPPVPILRFFQPGHIRYERLVNPVAIIDGPAGSLSHRFLHYNFSKGLTEWFDKHNKYSLAEAIEAIKILDRDSDLIAVLRRRRPSKSGVEERGTAHAVPAARQVHLPLHLAQRPVRRSARTHLLPASVDL